MNVCNFSLLLVDALRLSTLLLITQHREYAPTNLLFKMHFYPTLFTRVAPPI